MRTYWFLAFDSKTSNVFSVSDRTVVENIIKTNKVKNEYFINLLVIKK